MLFDDDDAFLETELCSAESLHYAWPSFPLLNSRNALVSSTETSEISIWGEHPCQQASRRESLTFTFFSYDSFPTDPRKGFLSRPLWSSWQHSRAGLSSTFAEKDRGQPLGAAGPRLKYNYGDLCITPPPCEKAKARTGCLWSLKGTKGDLCSEHSQFQHSGDASIKPVKPYPENQHQKQAFPPHTSSYSNWVV